MNSAVRPVLLAAAVAGLFVSSAANAAGIWQVERGLGGACTMTATYGGTKDGAEIALAFVYDPGASGLSFLAASPAFKDLPQREGNPGRLLLTFDGKAKYSEWESEKAPIRKLAGDSRAVVGEWGADYSQFLADAVTSSTHIAIRYGQSDLGTYDLDGVAQAYNELQRCSGKS